jgi:hypothetical protein
VVVKTGVALQSRRILDSTIGFPAVTDGDDVDESPVIINGENDPLGTHANSPQIFFSPQFPATVRTRIGCQASMAGKSRRTIEASKPSNSQRADLAKVTA